MKRVQEWLTLHNFSVAIDGDFGPATERALRAFQSASIDGQRYTPGHVDETTWNRLVMPMSMALRPIEASGRPLGEVLVALARQHVEQEPQECGGDNRGPWVRLYMNRAGETMPWCAGFATYLLRTAARACNVPAPHAYCWGCDQLAHDADVRGLLFSAHDLAGLRGVKPGYLFLVRSGRPRSWRHIGIVEAVDAESGTMTTLEANTNDGGSANGYKACRRTRGMANHDYLIV